MPSIDEVAERIAAAGAPALFLDTCILLDIIRSTHRCLPNYAARASELLTLASKVPPTCVVIVSSIVPHEWNTNAKSVTDDVDRHMIEMEEQSLHFHDACQALDISVPFGRANYGHWGLVEKLRNLSQNILDRAIHLDADHESRVRAVERVISNRPPSRNRGEVKDCAIIEECLAICRGSDAAGFAGKRVFCTSNTRDYCETGGRLHPALDTEFAACNLTFTTNLAWAIHEITH
jgi:hypothetical protein